LLLVDGARDLREALAPHAAVLTDFLRQACLEAQGGDDRRSPELEEAKA
jgi:hypothetical protein